MPSKVFDVEGTTSSDENSIARGICTYFTNVAKILQMSLVTLRNTIWRNHNNENLMKNINPENIQFSFKTISAYDLVITVNQLKRSKAGGYDNIPRSLQPL